MDREAQEVAIAPALSAASCSWHLESDPGKRLVLDVRGGAVGRRQAPDKKTEVVPRGKRREGEQMEDVGLQRLRRGGGMVYDRLARIHVAKVARLSCRAEAQRGRSV